LDNAGKTTILYRLKLGNVVKTIPTIGFNVETIQYKNIKLQAWDIGGQTSLRPHWRSYYNDTDAIIYVVDATDRKRIGIAKQELHTMLEEDELKNTILMILANKQDIIEEEKKPMSVNEINERLGLLTIKDHTWSIFSTSGKTGMGINEAFDWLITKFSS